jgi:hypothetical protein
VLSALSRRSILAWRARDAIGAARRRG